MRYALGIEVHKLEISFSIGITVFKLIIFVCRIAEKVFCKSEAKEIANENFGKVPLLRNISFN